MQRRLIILAALLTLVVSCKKEDPIDPATNFDKGQMLTNIADNLILPSLSDFQVKVNTLQTSYSTFTADQSIGNLEIVKESWKEAYLAWQTIKIYDFGPFRTYGFKGAIGTYPTDTALVESNISSGTYNLASAANADAIGFSALDYLFFNSDALSRFTSEANYRIYGSDVISKMVSETNMVVNDWASYRSTFIASTGTETTSAFSELVNEFNRDYELAKNAKIGIPIGKQSFGIQLPEYIEARYSGFSFELLNKSIESIQDLYNGVAFTSGSNGVGFDDYLIHLDKGSLNTTINNRFNSILTKISTFNNTLEVEMSQNVAALDELYSLIQGQVVNLKTDMTSSFGVLITYQDNDGD